MAKRPSISPRPRLSTFSILMDMRMPVTDGPAATQRIRAGTGPNRSTTIQAFTADPRRDHETVGLGFDGFVGKPIAPAELLSVLARWLSPGAGDAPGPELAVHVR